MKVLGSPRDEVKKAAFLLALATAFFGYAPSASANSIYALNITPTFESSITTDQNAAAIEATIETAISFYTTNLTTFTSAPVNVLLDFTEGGGLGSSDTTIYSESYTNVHNALISGSSGDATDTTALASLPTTQPISGQNMTLVTSANGRALGFNTPGGVNGSFDGQITLNTALTTPGSPGSTLQYSLLAVIEHELDEVLGLGSDEGDAAGTGTFSEPRMEDLFRYTTGGVRAWNQSTTCDGTGNGPIAYFSLNGTTPLSYFNNCANGGDYGDWYSVSGTYPGYGPQVQDAYMFPGNSPFLTRSSVEVVALDAIGYNLAAVPEPGTFALFGAGLAAVAFHRRRSRTHAL